MGSGSVRHSILSVNSLLLLLPHLFTRFRFSRSLIGSAIITTFCAPLAAFVCFFHFLVRRFPTQFVESIPTSRREIGIFEKQTCADNVICGIHSAFSLMAIFLFWRDEKNRIHSHTPFYIYCHEEFCLFSREVLTFCYARLFLIFSCCFRSLVSYTICYLCPQGHSLLLFLFTLPCLCGFAQWFSRRSITVFSILSFFLFARV